MASCRVNYVKIATADTDVRMAVKLILLQRFDQIARAVVTALLTIGPLLALAPIVTESV